MILIPWFRTDGSANKKLYGRDLSAKEIVREGKVAVPVAPRFCSGTPLV